MKKITVGAIILTIAILMCVQSCSGIEREVEEKTQFPSIAIPYNGNYHSHLKPYLEEHGLKVTNIDGNTYVTDKIIDPIDGVCSKIITYAYTVNSYGEITGSYISESVDFPDLRKAFLLFEVNSRTELYSTVLYLRALRFEEELGEPDVCYVGKEKDLVQAWYLSNDYVYRIDYYVPSCEIVFSLTKR